jgi:DNA-binding MarR family transcriptional regulator
MERYLQFTAQAQQINGGFDLNHYEIQLLDLTATAYSLGQPIFIGDLIYQRHIASQATLHASVKKLIAKELLCIKPHEGDGRTKELRLTTLAIDRYKRLQKAMRRALTR